MEINDSQLKYLYEAFRRGSMRAASEHFDVAPSSISRQIAGLERQLGVALVERGRHAVKLTPAGQLLVSYYRESLHQRQGLIAALDDLRGMRQGSVSLAVGQGLVGSILIPAMAAFRREFPGIRLNLHEVANQQVISMVVDDEVHFGVVLEPPREPRLRSRLRLAQPLRLVMRPNHPLAKRASVSLQELVAEPLILAGPSFRSRQILEQITREEGLQLDPAITCSSIPMVLSCALAGLGLALLTELYVTEHVAAGRLAAVPIAHPALDRVAIHTVVRVGRRLPKSAVTLLDLLEEATRGALAGRNVARNATPRA